MFGATLVPWPSLAHDFAGIEPQYNLAPTQRAAVVLDADGELRLRKLRWGLIPPWARDAKSGYSTINARVETVATKPAYRAAWKAPRRCLVPMAGYYEWKDERDGKQPYYVTRADGAALYAAGLWEPKHRLQGDDSEGSVTLITRDAVDDAGEVHDRMPVFLDPAQAREWMTAGSEDAMAMLMAAPVPKLRIVRVGREINSSRHRGGPESVEAVEQT